MRIFYLTVITTVLLGQPFLLAEATEAFSPVGYYETLPGKAGEYNRLNVSEHGPNLYSVSVTTVYCAYAFSPDCSNARGGELQFVARQNENTLVSKDTQCMVKIIFKGDSAVVQQAGECPTNPYGTGTKPFKKRSSIPKVLSE